MKILILKQIEKAKIATYYIMENPYTLTSTVFFNYTRHGI